MIRPEQDTIFIASFGQLPAGGIVHFSPPEVAGSLQIENANIDSASLFAEVEFDVRTRHTYKQVTLERTDKKPLQIFHANPDFPEGFDDLSFIRNTDPALVADWQRQAFSVPDQQPAYMLPLRYALQRPVGRLVLQKYPEPDQLLGNPTNNQWVVAGGAEVRNAYALGKFLELAGKAAVRKLQLKQAA